MIRPPTEILLEALERNPVASFVGFSGGRDSLAVTHWMMNRVPGCQVFHINTGIGIERTREFVRETCRAYGWPLHEVRAKEDCGQDYDELVREFGFPGPDGHQLMYARLKERAIRKIVRDVKATIANRKKRLSARVMFATGLRFDESVRRMRYAGREVNLEGAQLWVNPIYWWSASARDAYIAEHKLPINPVSAMLGMSGECLCGAYAYRGEKALVRLVDPATAERLDRLEHEVCALGFTWGWEGRPPKGGRNKAQTAFNMPLCVGCEKVHDEAAEKEIAA